jgi:hypothetical protein
VIKGSRYLLLKNAPNLLGSQRKALQELLAANKAPNTVSSMNLFQQSPKQ